MLREHPITQGPEAVDRADTVARAAPEAWKPYGITGEVDVLALTDEPFKGRAGWCTYRNTLDEGADVEWICGGINHKHPEAAAIWRQGFLLHFGFEPGPDALNANGKALLANSIVYIAGFRGDRPLVRTPSGFVAKDVPRPRTYLRTTLKAKVPQAKAILANLDPSLHAELAELATPALVAWCQERMDWLRAGPNGSLVLDADAQRLGVTIDSREGLARCVAALADESTKGAALRVLERSIPEGPRSDAAASSWSEWWQQNADYLFFSEIAGQTWCVDSLARARHVPTAKLRGPARRDAEPAKNAK